MKDSYVQVACNSERGCNCDDDDEVEGLKRSALHANAGIIADRVDGRAAPPAQMRVMISSTKTMSGSSLPLCYGWDNQKSENVKERCQELKFTNGVDSIVLIYIAMVLFSVDFDTSPRR